MKFRLVESLEKATPYMLRNDGELLECGDFHPYLKYWYDSYTKFDQYLFRALIWFYKNTQKESTKRLIRIVLKYAINNDIYHQSDIDKHGIELIDVYDAKEEEIESFVDSLNDDVNQEFCRVRTSGIIFGGNSDDIYFRISSIGFNWFPLIWKTVYENKPSSVTITKDDGTFGGGNKPYRMSGIEMNHIPFEDFIMLSGNPVIEKLKSKFEFINDSQNEFSHGKTMTETFNWTHPRHAHHMYERQVEEQLEFDINNLLRKE